MNGLKPVAETLPNGVEYLKTSGSTVISIPDRMLVEDLIRIGVETPGKIRFRAGISSRSRVRLDIGFPQNEKERNVECEFILEPGACVDVFHLVEGEPGRGSLSVTARYHLKKHAALNVWTYVGGGEFSRIEQEVTFSQEHGFASLRGLSVLDGGSQVVHKVKAHHAAGHCISRQFYKSIVAGNAKSGFESLVLAAKGAVRSDSKQLNKNLLLSGTAEAWSRPELRILTDDVSCAHGSATGELAADELFYLRSRGLAPETARFMMIEGFAAEAIEDASYAPLKTYLRELVQKRIKEMSVEG
jgi:Fe-S cluster assembly protein SufD